MIMSIRKFLAFVVAMVLIAPLNAFMVNKFRTSLRLSNTIMHAITPGDFSSKSNGMNIPNWGGRDLRMADPDVPPEVDPTRRDPDDPGPEIPVRLPMVDFGGTKMDVNSRLLKDRIIMIGKQVDDNMANVVVAQLLYLANEDPTADITMYINSPGGSISSGMAIFDTMQFIPCDVSTVCFGMAASMGAFLLGAGM